MTVGNFPQFFKRFAAAGKFRPYHNLHAAFRHRRRYARHNLRRLIDRKTAFGFVFLSVRSAKEYALRTVFFIDFEFSPSIKMSAPMVSVPSVRPVAVSVTAAIFAVVSFTPSTLTEISSKAFRMSAVGTISTVRRWIFSS